MNDTKTIKSFTQWAALNSALAALFVAAYHLDIEGARNVFVLLLWGLFVPASLLCVVAKGATRRAAEEPPTPIRSVIGRALAWFMLLSLAWQGHIFTAVGWGMFMLLGAVYRFGVRQEREKLKGAAA